jgi:integrase
MAHLIDQYRRSSDWSQLKASTQRDYKRYLDKLSDAAGHLPATRIDASFIASALDRLQDTRGKANHTLAIYRTLFQWGKAPGRNFVTVDPTVGFEKMAGVDDDLTFHGLRHTTGSMLAEAGATAPQIQAILGHKSLQTVMVYIKQAQQKLQAAQGMALLQVAKPTAKPAVSA